MRRQSINSDRFRSETETQTVNLLLFCKVNLAGNEKIERNCKMV